MSTFVKTVRWGAFQPFFRVNGTVGERQTDLDVGLVTYTADDHYQISSARVGGRCDHISDITQRDCTQVESGRINQPFAEDADLIVAAGTTGVQTVTRTGEFAKLSQKRPEVLNVEPVRDHAGEVVEIDEM